MKTFSENRAYIENECQNAHFDPATGVDPELLYGQLREIFQNSSDEPWQLVYATAYAHLLDHVQLEINEHTPFSVKMNLGIDFTYFAGSTIFHKAMTPRGTMIYKEKLPVEYAQYQKFAGASLGWMLVDFGHTVPNWPYLFENGFAGILKNAQDSKAALLAGHNYKETQITFLDSVIICYRAILRLLDRIYTYSLKFNVPQFSECIKNLFENPPRTLYEVMQFSVLYTNLVEIGVERSRTLGPIDLLYLPYYKTDIANGCTDEEVAELFRYFFIRYTAEKRYAEQPLTLCGSDKDGNDYTNVLSHMMLDVYDEMNIFNPKIHIRYHKNLDDRILQKVAKMIRKGNNSICILSDEAVFKGYERIGIPREDAQRYVVLGCYEPIIMGEEEGQIAALRFNTVKCVEFAINGGKDLLTGNQVGYASIMDIGSFEELMDIYLKQLDYCTDFALDYIQKMGQYSTLVCPVPIYSSSFPACIAKGMDVHEYPLKYNNLSLKHHGLATTVDSLFAIKKYVFDRKELSLADMRKALSQDWQGFEELQSRIVADKEKYGNNMDAPDRIMTDITEHLAERYVGRELERGGKVRLGLDSVYHCIIHGQETAATSDGRNAKKPISKNLCASDGMDRGGITAYMQSVLKIDSTAFLDGAPLDFILHPSAIEGEKGLADFLSLIKIFLDNGGFAIQGNVVSGETLKEAQKHPEKYATLQVRVCGWNEYFVNLSKVKQDMFIKQCEVSG